MILTKEEVDLMALEELATPDSKANLGGNLFKFRQRTLAEKSCAAGPGDLIEIGVLAGDTSILLAEIARKYGRRLICIDNWPTTGVAAPYRLDLAEASFYRQMSPYEDVYELWRVDANAPETLDRIRKGEWAYALSDDGHQYEDHFQQLCALLPVSTGIVVADDVYYHNTVKDAMIHAMLRNPDWKILHADNLALREGFMVRG